MTSEDGDNVLILENTVEHIIKCQMCEEEKRKSIVDDHAWIVGQITWTVVANWFPPTPSPNIHCVGSKVSIWTSFKC